MTEAIRFYWRGRACEHPVWGNSRAGPHTVADTAQCGAKNAPTVVKQLDAGGFVTVAWEGGGQIHLILCYPDLGKGSADTFLLNTQMLPQLVLSVTGWDQAPEAAELFLRAFGSEAANVDECVAARRELVGWLGANGQPEMSKSVKHYSTFPFDVRSDALEVINIWRKISVEGQEKQIDQFLSEIDQRFAGVGWSHDPGD